MTIHTVYAVTGVVVLSLFLSACGEPQNTADAVPADQNEILYWVAPMDPDFRRPGPGKSPMGMDLVPVYANQGAGKGVVQISPSIENNISVRSEVVGLSPLQFQLQSSGELQVAEDKRWHIHSRTAGWIEQLAVEYSGQTITAGAPLYAIYSPELVDAKEDFVRAIRAGDRSQIQAAKLRLNAMKVDPRVLAELHNNPSSPVDQLTWYFSEQDAVVDALNINQGMYVKPEQTLMSLVNYDELWLLLELPASQVIPLARASEPSIELINRDIPGRFWRGELDYFYPQLNSQLRTQTLRIVVENQNLALHPGMWMQLNLQLQSDVEVLRVPKEAVIRTAQGDRVVMALGDGRFKSVAVTLGQHDQQYFEVLSGLRAGDKVVTSAQFLLDSESMKESDLKRLQHQHVREQQND